MAPTARVAAAISLSFAAAIGLAAQGAPPAQAPPPATAPQSSPQRGGQPCTPATDPEYGLTAAKAVQIGGGPLYMAARERRYLDSLKGPGGQTLTYKRLGATALKPNGAQPIDMWEVTWEGAPKPVTLFLFAYLYGEPKVPAGFTCAAFTLGNPPIDGFISREQRAIVAVTQGLRTISNRFPSTPTGPQRAVWLLISSGSWPGRRAPPQQQAHHLIR